MLYILNLNKPEMLNIEGFFLFCNLFHTCERKSFNQDPRSRAPKSEKIQTV